MKDIYLINYSVKGIKSLDQLVSLAFYKKTISRYPQTQQYNIKGIYGINGSGKSGIVASVDILKNLLINSGYLTNPIVQTYLDAIINYNTKKMSIAADFIAEVGNSLWFFRYEITLEKDFTGKYVISFEALSSKKITSKKVISRNDSLDSIYKIVNGEIVFENRKENDEIYSLILKKTTNLLSTATICALFFEKVFVSMPNSIENRRNTLFISLCVLFVLGKKLHVYTEQSDDHREYFLSNSLGSTKEAEKRNSELNCLLKNFMEMDCDHLNVLSVTGNIVPKRLFSHFKGVVGKLYDFLHIFKADLQGIDIDKKEDHDVYVCDLVMKYASYNVHAEFESTGIKKLIRLFAYLREMVQGGIVFIDEFDANLHDVYLCALLEYIMEYGEGQLCFTTHNVGPMDVLKQHKKSIDFLSVDHTIYPWTTDGNYSPSKLYRNGLIEGSPFNVDSIDFIGVLNSDEEVV